MKFSFTHLPAQVQSDLRHIADFLVEQTILSDKTPQHRYTPSRIRHIILHGCFTEDHWKPETEIRSDKVSNRYNIMVIISAHLCDILHILERAVAQLNQSGQLSFPVALQIADTKGRIDQKLRNGYLAYDHIQTKGILIYSKGNITRDLFMMPDQPSAEKHLAQAQGYYDQAYPLAQLFLSGARSFEGKGRNATAFMLNISAAQAYEAFMVVHILKYPLGRPLNDLRELAESIHPELSMIWSGLRGNQMFDLLTKAFRDVRFSADYKITNGELNLMFGYVEDLHKMVYHICMLKLEALKAGSLKKPNKAWLEVVGEALKPHEDGLFNDNDEVLSSPIIRTAAQEEAFVNLRSAIFDIEEPCYELERLGSVLKAMAYGDDDAEQSGLFVMGRIVQERAVMVKGVFKQMVALLKQTRLRDDDPVKR